MAKYSISKMLEGKRKMRIVTLLVCLAVVALVSNLIVSKNPKGTKAFAITIDYDATLYNNVACNVLSVCTAIGVGDDLVIGNPAQAVTVTMSGANRFKSLKVENNAVVTHEGITVNAADGDSTDQRFLSNNKVELILSEGLDLRSGGRIDVSGKGFQPNDSYRWDGAPPMKNEGPGGGWAVWRYHNENTPAGGAGYGGRGGPGDPTGGAPDSGRGAVYLSDPPIRAGSSGGNADGREMGNSRGGAGGGRVHIVANTVAIDSTSGIYANGNAGQKNSQYTAGGGGSGGSIWIQLTGDQADYLQAESNGSTGYGGENSTPVFHNFSEAEIAANVQANGGSAHFGGWGGGGGGRILIERIHPDRVSIQKILYPVSRGGVECASRTNCFNPYAMQAGDVIDVSITLSPLDYTGEVTVFDEYLRQKDYTSTVSALACVYEPDLDLGYDTIDGIETIARSVSSDANGVNFTFTPNQNTIIGRVVQMHYECRVRSR